MDLINPWALSTSSTLLFHSFGDLFLFRCFWSTGEHLKMTNVVSTKIQPLPINELIPKCFYCTQIHTSLYIEYKIFHFTGRLPGSLPHYYVTRGCQSLRYGATCEDIFHHLRNSGEILPGRHICSTCSSDLCNSSNVIKFSLFCSYSVIALLSLFYIS